MSAPGSIYNPTDSPVVIDGYGHVLGGREHRAGVNLDSERIAAHIKAGRLIGTPDPAPTKKTGTTTASTSAATDTEES